MLNDEHRIRLSNTDSVNSVNKEQFVDVNIQHHAKSFPFPSISDTIDQMAVFESERENGTKYRLVVTIAPYCSNILFNAVTEIVQNEGSEKEKGDEDALQIIGKDKQAVSTGVTINGLTNVNNTDMIRDTEYSNGERPFVYHCGYDIFNNHILRNQTFKLVNPITNKTKQGEKKEVYNTIKDYMRYSNGQNIQLFKRANINDIRQDEYKHLYLKEDILSLTDSINANLNEKNGWYGFGNRSTIPSCEWNEKDKRWDDLKISKVFNTEITDEGEIDDRIACGFIEMYPDSSLYSFNPKYNFFQNREEQNWDICLTYPYENDNGFYIDNNGNINVDKVLINGIAEDGKTILNALLLADYAQTVGTSGQDIILFRSYIKHNLKSGDKIKLFYNDSNLNKESNFKDFGDKIFTVVNIGNLGDEYQDYYFYVNDINNILETLGETTLAANHCFRFRKVNNDRDCKYYYRKFKKIPNFKAKKEELTDEIARDKESFDAYVLKNGEKNNKMRLFCKEQYPLAFSRTIYGDDISQITFTDSVDIDKLVDNLGRPVTKIYLTIIKRNAGHDVWYKKDKKDEDLKTIEYSHCFGRVTSGIEVHGEWSDDNVLLLNKREINDVTTIANDEISYGHPLDKDITIDTDEFYGDIVELDNYNMMETTLSDVCFRFNTEQREHNFSNDEINCGNFAFDEIISDDFDLSGFVCTTYDADKTGPNETDHTQITTYRPEGYYYKAHYPILVREFGKIHQGSYKEINVSSASPRQAEGLFIEVVSRLRSGVTSGDIVYLCNSEESIKIPLIVHSVQSNIRFLINPMTVGDKNYLSVFEIARGLMYSKKEIKEDTDTWTDKDGYEHYGGEENAKGTVQNDYSAPKYILRIKNESIPFYAQEVATNVYLWREVLNVGNKDNVELSEYPFANGHFYINKEINFFLKRQDPFGYNGLMNQNLWPNDIFGNTKKTSNYEYKDDTNIIC